MTSDKQLILAVCPFNPRVESLSDWKRRFSRLFGTAPSRPHELYYERQELSSIERQFFQLAASGRINLNTIMNHHLSRMEREYEETR